MTNQWNRFDCRKACEGDPSRGACAVAAPPGERRRCQSLSIPVLTCDVPSFSTPLITEEGLGVGGGLYSLDWAFDSAFRLVHCLATMNLDDWIQRQCCQAGMNLGPSHAPTSIFFSLRSSYNNLRTLCKTIHSITPVREVWFRHTWAGSLVCWWPGKTPRWPTGCNRAGKSLNRENLRALRKPNYFPAKRLNPDCKRGMWTADIFPVSRFPLHLEMCKSLNSTVKYGSWRHMIFETPKDCKTVFALATRNFRVSI